MEDITTRSPEKAPVKKAGYPHGMPRFGLIAGSQG